jgi:hypothetical protein
MIVGIFIVVMTGAFKAGALQKINQRKTKEEKDSKASGTGDKAGGDANHPHPEAPGAISDESWNKTTIKLALIFLVGAIAIVWVSGYWIDSITHRWRSTTAPIGSYSTNPMVVLHPPTPPLPPIGTSEYPASGEQFATKSGLKVWLDPARSHTRPSQAVRCQLAGHEFSFIDRPNIPTPGWSLIPAGGYVCYPLEGNEAYYKWWAD